MRSLLIATLLAGASVAQESAPKVEVSFYALDYARGHKDIFVPTGAENYEEVQLSTANISAPVTAELRDGRLTLHAVEAGEDGNFPVISSVRLPSAGGKALVLLAPAGGGGEDVYRTLVFANDRKDFPLGTYRMVNLSPYPVRGVIGRSTVRAKPGRSANLEPEGEPGSVQPARFEYRSQDRWNLLTETRCAIRKDRRWLMCVFEDPRSGRINIRSIPDRSVTPKRGEREE